MSLGRAFRGKGLGHAWALAILALGLGCDATLARPKPQPYMPWEDGLTLIYERMDLPEAQRLDHRVQIRVAKSTLEGDVRKIELTSTTLQREERIQLTLKDGSVSLVDGKGPGASLLPSGFPDQAQHWQTGQVVYEVVGRAKAQLPGLDRLPAASQIGVWVEARLPNGFRERTFYLPGIGEAENRVFHRGRWVTTTRLVSRGFTDLPMRPSKD